MKDNRLKGIFFILLAAFGFATMAVFVRATGPLPVMEKMLFRNLVSAVFSLGIMLKSGERPVIPKAGRVPVVLRSVCGMTGAVCNYWALDHLMIADATILAKMSPFFCIFASWVILSEVPARTDFVFLLTALCGAALVIKPGAEIVNSAALVALFGGAAAGAAYAFVRKTSKAGVPGGMIILFFSLFSCLVSVPFVLLDYVPMTGRQICFMLLAGTFAGLGQLGITKAYTYAPAKEISVFDYSQILFAALYGFVFFGEFPDALSLAGYAVIIGTAVFRWNLTRTKSG